jgi:hypothetical protein
MNNIYLQDIDPRVELSHYQEMIGSKREKIGLGSSKVPLVLMLDSQHDRKRYLLCLAAVREFQSVHGSRGINTLTDMGEYITLVDEIAKGQTQTPASELRTFSLDLLRSMRSQMQRRRA